MSTKVLFGIRKDVNNNIIYNDISNYLRDVSIDRGKSNELAVYDAASFKITLSNELRLFDPSYAPSPFSQDVKPTGSVQIYANDVLLIQGLINDWNFSYDQSGDAIAEINGTDGFWTLNNLILADDTNAVERSDIRMIEVLGPTKANWPSTKQKISQGLATLGADFISQGTTVLSYLQQIEASEPGRLFMSKDGSVIFKSRTDSLFRQAYSFTRKNLSTNPSFTNDTVGWSGVGTITRNTVFGYVGSTIGFMNLSGATTPAFYQPFNANPNSTYTCSVLTRNQTAGAGTVTLNGYQSYDGTTWELKGTTSMTTASRPLAIVNYAKNSKPSTLTAGTNIEGWVAGRGTGSGTSILNTGGYFEDTITVAPSDNTFTVTIGGALTSQIQGLTAGVTYSVSLNVISSIDDNRSLLIQWTNSSGTVIGTGNTAREPLPAGIEVTLTNTAVAPAGATGMNLVVGNGSGGDPAVTRTLGSVFQARYAMVTANATPLDYFNGDTLRSETTRYKWSGTANASASQAIVFERPYLTFAIDDGYVSGRFEIASNTALYIDGILIEETPFLDSYFDGTDRPANTTNPSFTYTSVWDGV